MAVIVGWRTTDNDFLVDDVFTARTATDEGRGQAQDDHGTGPLQCASDELERARDGG